MKIYFAAPLFTTAERTFNEAMFHALSALGHSVWLPQIYENAKKTDAEAFGSDVTGIDWCDAVVGCMDGPDPDSGTCWECGSVWRRKPVVLFRTDSRALAGPMNSPFNLMLTRSAEAVIECQWMQPKQIAEAVSIALHAICARPGGLSLGSPDPHRSRPAIHSLPSSAQ